MDANRSREVDAGERERVGGWPTSKGRDKAIGYEPMHARGMTSARAGVGSHVARRRPTKGCGWTSEGNTDTGLHEPWMQPASRKDVDGWEMLQVGGTAQEDALPGSAWLKMANESIVIPGGGDGGTMEVFMSSDKLAFPLSNRTVHQW